MRIGSHTILYSFKHKQILLQKKVFQASLEKNQLAFSHTCKKFTPQFFSLDSNKLLPSEKYKFFISKISEAISLNTPIRKTVKPNIHRNPVSWWDEKCNNIKEERKDAYKKWAETLELRDLISYKRIVALRRNTFKNKKN